MAAETQYIANTGMVQISTANSNLDGSGTLGTVITANGSKNGILIKTVTVKSIQTTTQGMVRLFIYDGSNTRLIKEIEIPAVVKSFSDPAFQTTVLLNFQLKAGYSLKASTEKGEIFNIIAEAQDWTYYTTSVRADTTKYIPYNSYSQISTANSLLDGTGTLGDALTSSGCNLQSIAIKAIVNTTDGMIRIFLFDGTSTTLLLTEIPVVATTKSSIAQAFYKKIVFENGFALKSGWHIKVSTEKGENFNIITE